MSQQTPSLPGTGSAMAASNAVDDAIQQLLALNISNNEEVTSDTQIREQQLARAKALTIAKKNEHYLIRNTPLELSYETLRAFGVFFDNVALLLCLLRLKDNSDDIYADLVYDRNMNDVKLWIWIWSGANFERTKERMEEFENSLRYLIAQANSNNVYWDQVRVVWRISHMGQTWSREVAWWPSQCGQNQPLADCLRSFPQSAVRLGWFQSEENLGMPVKSWLRSMFLEAWRAENQE
ncbi:hypothetical protein F4680DRAFT_345238 [Xylaria scruposa]|nr:hypothetical protein F4680DRAFT_345238 [Xylaria scruposa]